MPRPIAIFYHCVLNGPHIPSEDYAICVLQSQMMALKQSGLEDASSRIVVGVNGGDGDFLLVCSLAPKHSKVMVMCNKGGQSEIPTMQNLRDHLNVMQGHNVLYFHTKGVSYPGNQVWTNWRNCMEKVCVWNWKECVEALVGYDTVGAHWITHEKYSSSGVLKGQRYWGGNFWWATSDYLLTLPPLPPDSREARYEAETWIGKSRIPPLVHDFAPHFPMNCPP